MPSRQTEPGLDLGDLGAAHRHTMRSGAVELDHRAIPLLAHQADMRDRHDVTTVDADELAGVELGFDLRDRPLLARKRVLERFSTTPNLPP